MTAHGKWKFQQAFSAAQYELQKTLHATLDQCNCGEPENLKFIQLGEEHTSVICNHSRKSLVNFTDIPQLVNKGGHC
jgi:hypothetical protein